MIPITTLFKKEEPIVNEMDKNYNERDIDEYEASHHSPFPIYYEGAEFDHTTNRNVNFQEMEKDSLCKRTVQNYDHFFRNSEYFRKKNREEIINRIRLHACQRQSTLRRETHAKTSLEKQIHDLDKAILEDSIRKEEIEKRLDQNRTLKLALKDIAESM